MTEEELREKIAREIGNAVFACQNDPGWRTTESADQILTLIREAGFLTPDMVKGLMFEVQAQKCAKCPKNKEGQPAD